MDFTKKEVRLFDNLENICSQTERSLVEACNIISERDQEGNKTEPRVIREAIEQLVARTTLISASDRDPNVDEEPEGSWSYKQRFEFGAELVVFLLYDVLMQIGWSDEVSSYIQENAFRIFTAAFFSTASQIDHYKAKTKTTRVLNEFIFTEGFVRRMDPLAKKLFALVDNGVKQDEPLGDSAKPTLFAIAKCCAAALHDSYTIESVFIKEKSKEIFDAATKKFGIKYLRLNEVRDWVFKEYGVTFEAKKTAIKENKLWIEDGSDLSACIVASPGNCLLEEDEGQIKNPKVQNWEDWSLPLVLLYTRETADNTFLTLRLFTENKS